MKKFIKRIKTNKTLLILLTIIIIFIIIGILFPSLISKVNKKLIATSLDNFFIKIKKNDLNYYNAFISSISTNLIIIIILWILGISIISIFITPLIVGIKSFILGFSISSILITYKIKGLIIGIIYIIPQIVNIFILLIISYYSINFSKLLFNYIFKKTNNIRKNIVKRYIKILIFSISITTISSIIEVFIIPYIYRILI